jgi:uncharacterized protein involved in exopolysaccharide biosynthesis
LRNIKVLRDLKYYQTMYELLAKQYELARLDEARDTPVVQVLDPAIVPERKARPQGALMAISAAMIGLFFAMAVVFFRDTKSRLLQRAGFRQKWLELTSYLRLRR